MLYLWIIATILLLIGVVITENLFGGKKAIRDLLGTISIIIVCGWVFQGVSFWNERKTAVGNFLLEISGTENPFDKPKYQCYIIIDKKEGYVKYLGRDSRFQNLGWGEYSGRSSWLKDAEVVDREKIKEICGLPEGY